MISCSGRTVRVVQGVVDTLDNTVEMRIAGRINFDYGIRDNADGFLDLLGWFLGNPVGRTQ